ncbi:right-handed parallel beta-helix repeat-containing protein [Kineococcus glutinatus]|uniref:Right-handed parallel beta-helix repeat-containing protein n=1 Tax=Kineococcus glutinatus TaxID=1070872 RepID=A0ABP9H4F7_9ACTN
MLAAPTRHRSRRSVRCAAAALLGGVAAITAAPPATAAGAVLRVGPGKPFATPCAAFARAADGDVVEIDGSVTYTGDVCGIHRDRLTVRGVNGRPRIDAGGRNAMGKGTWVVVGDGVVVDNVEMYGARVADRNGAALRLEGTGFTLRRSYLHDNENGILSGADPASDVLVETSEFARNGHGDGYSHNLYIGNVRSLTFRHNFSHDANVGHDLKSRARTNTITYNRFSSLPAGQAGSGRPSYEIDLPNAGTAVVVGNVVQQPAGSSNAGMLAYGTEGASNPGTDLYVVNNTFLNDDTARGTFVLVGSGVTTPVRLQNNVFAGVGTLVTQAGAVQRTNHRAASPAFADRARYDLTPTAGSAMVGTGSAPGTTAGGVALTPVAHYRHVASAAARPAAGTIDIGAYELAGSTR